MATLEDPINNQNIVDRFADYVVASANAGIVWGTNSVPFAEFPTSYFGGTTAGKDLAITGENIGTSKITANTIYDALVAETNVYTRIRSLRARLNVLGGGGNTGTRPTPGIVYDQTRIAHMSNAYAVGIGSPAKPTNGIITGGIIAIGTSAGTGSGLEEQFDVLRNSYLAARSNTVLITIDVCHASCHSSCHGSRGRR